MISVLAHSVAEPLLPGMSEARDGVVLGGGDGALYARFEDMVVAVTARGIGRMPNGVSVGVAPDTLARVRAGDAARVWPGGLAAGPMEVLWDPDAPPSWSPRLADVPPDDGPAIRQRLRHPSLQQDVPAEELRALGGAVASRDPSLAGMLGETFVGAGSGLTPRGDDLLAGTALALRALGRASGWSHREVDAWVAKLLPPELPARTTALSASLLRLAVAGDALEPARRLLDPAEPDPRAAMLSLLGIGRSTGRSYAAAMRVVASTA
ncbi:MAG TPA: DUF2877 domain-containing protein [Actinomycetota bacterium]|nr:DUF2877 domain-containing protein [Actinomycetota bacterium]